MRLAANCARRLAEELEWTEEQETEIQRVEENFARLVVKLQRKDAELQCVKRDNRRLAAALQRKEAELQCARRDNELQGDGDSDSEKARRVVYRTMVNGDVRRNDEIHYMVL